MTPVADAIQRLVAAARAEERGDAYPDTVHVAEYELYAALGRHGIDSTGFLPEPDPAA